MYIISRIDYKIYKRFDKLGYWISVLLLLAVLIPGLGKAARRSKSMDCIKTTWGS